MALRNVHSKILIMLVLFMALYLYNDHVATNYLHSRNTQMRMAVIKTLGGPAIPIISQCSTSRNLTEGIYARRSDIPGGLCFHSDCDVVVNPGVLSEKIYSITVIKKKV